MPEVREIPIVSGACNPQSFELSDALFLTSEKKQMVAFAVEKHPFFGEMRGVAFLVRVQAVERLPNREFKITGVTVDEEGHNHAVEAVYNFSSCRGVIKMDLP